MNVPHGALPWLCTLISIAGVGSGQQQTGFLDRLYKAPDGASAKYVLFVPHNYDGRTAVPVIVFLHGAGATGTDGRQQVQGALGAAIRKREKTFPFLVIFPQAHEGSWQAGSPDGKRVLAILDQAAADFQINAKRIYLTGLSMGGEGTWSLAAAHPRRWAAIVPLCGGGDTRSVHRFKDIPCWCFHGDADRVIHVQQSRAMISALKKAGGRPLYHEYPGIGHNCWDRTYSNPDLYEWLLLQKLK